MWRVSGRMILALRDVDLRSLSLHISLTAIRGTELRTPQVIRRPSLLASSQVAWRPHLRGPGGQDRGAIRGLSIGMSKAISPIRPDELHLARGLRPPSASPRRSWNFSSRRQLKFFSVQRVVFEPSATWSALIPTICHQRWASFAHGKLVDTFTARPRASPEYSTILMWQTRQH